MFLHNVKTFHQLSHTRKLKKKFTKLSQVNRKGDTIV